MPSFSRTCLFLTFLSLFLLIQISINTIYMNTLFHTKSKPKTSEDQHIFLPTPTPSSTLSPRTTPGILDYEENTDLWDPHPKFIQYITEIETPAIKVDMITYYIKKAIRDQFSNCSEQKQVLQCFWKRCGFGCQVHAIVQCVHYAHKNDMLPFVPAKGSYMNDLYEFIKPLVPLSCNLTGRDVVMFDEGFGDNVFDVMPGWIRNEIGDYFNSFHGFYVSQYIHYLLRYQDEFQESVDAHVNRTGMKHPYVGVHIRRGDKRSEARYHDVEEYMNRVIAYFNLHYPYLKDEYKSAYIASDDINVCNEIKQKYPQFNIHCTLESSQASQMRYSETSLTYLIYDLAVLSKADFLVGTFSSQITRLSYELMQVNLAGNMKATGLMWDDGWYFGFGGIVENNKSVGIYLPDDTYRIIDDQFQCFDESIK